MTVRRAGPLLLLLSAWLPALPHGASSGLHLHLDPDPAAPGDLVTIEVTAVEPLVEIEASFVDASAARLQLDPAVRRLTLGLLVPRDATGDVVNLQAEARTAGDGVLRASAVLGLRHPHAGRGGERPSPAGGAPDPCGETGVLRPLELADLIGRALRTLAAAGHRPADYELRLRRITDLGGRDRLADPRLRRSVVFSPRGRGYTVRVDAATPCLLAWDWQPARLTPWQRQVIKLARSVAERDWPATPAIEASEIEVLESREAIRLIVSRAGATAAGAEWSVTLKKSDLPSRGTGP